jgi:hypothetical protein
LAMIFCDYNPYFSPTYEPRDLNGSIILILSIQSWSNDENKPPNFNKFNI